jgi:branched-chain amino acid transport system permease protein
MELLNETAQFLISGLATGAIYALIGLSFAIIFNSTGIINFAQGEFVMLGGVLTIVSITTLKLPILIAVVVAVLGTTVVGVLFERLAIRPLKNATPLALIIITIGASILIRGMVMLLWGKDTQVLPSFSGNAPINFAGATLLPQHIWIFGVTILVIIGSRLFFHHTITGKAMRACSFNRRAANLVGISVGRMVLLSFVISAALGSLAGVIIAPLTMTAYDVGVMLGLKGFCAAIMGGMGSGLGTVLGGLILGVLESLGAGLISSGYKDAISFFILLLILFIRPQGLFKKGETDRV